MNKKIYIPLIILTVAASTYVFISKKSTPNRLTTTIIDEEYEKEGGAKRFAFEQMILKDPVTGKIPEGIRRKEFEAVKNIASRNGDGLARTTNQNTYLACGPTAEGGRTRALAPDVRYNGTTNRVIIAAGVNGGIYRSADGGTTWNWVHPENEIHAISAIAQDPRAGFQDTWYAGGAEYNGASAGISAGFIFGNGLFKSTDNGLTWTRSNPTIRNNDPAQTALAQGVEEGFDNTLDLVHRIAVHPTTGHVYIAGHRRIVRSTNGGTSFDVVLGSAVGATTSTGQTEIVISPNGQKIYAAFNGGNPDPNLVGVWESTTGNVDFQNSLGSNWTRIAGSDVNLPTGWNDDIPPTPANPNPVNGWQRIVLAVAPSNQNILYAAYYNNLETGISVDLFRGDRSNNTWTDLSANLTANRNTTATPFATQGGYDLGIAIKPNDPNVVFLVGTNLYRSSDGFSTANNNTFVGGYSSSTYTGFSHPDFHYAVFNPSNPNELFVANDGGLQKTTNCTATTINWTDLNNNYQTHQYYHVAIDPTLSVLNFAGGTQDNSTTLRDGAGLLSFLGTTNGPNDQWKLIGGDGAAVALTSKDPNNSNRQYLIGASQLGEIYRVKLFNDGAGGSLTSNIKPTGVPEGLFVTYFHMDNDNTNNLYYASDNTIYRTTSARTVTSGNWTNMTGVGQTITGTNVKVMSMATSRGGYVPNNNLFIGTNNGTIFRLTDPANTATTTAPTNILAPSSGLIAAGSVVLDIAVNPRNHDSVMAVVSNYGTNSIFFTGNATATTPTWTVCDGNISLPSVQSCEIVVKTTGVEYYVGTSVGLFSTTSLVGNSTAWVKEGSGMLKYAVVRSMAYRWNDNTMVIGTHGNGMFYTQIGNAVAITTGVNNIIRNDNNFIKKAFPSVPTNVITYEVGNMVGITKVEIRIVDAIGRLVLRKEEGYTNGLIDVSKLAAGQYVLTISNQSKKQQFVQKIIKQ
jgi:hypothetical protein